MEKERKTGKVIYSLIAVLILMIAYLNLSGKIEVVYSDTSFLVKATYWNDRTVDYDAIEKIEYHDELRPGKRTYGFENTRILCGNFRNDELNNYMRYTHKKCTPCVLIETDGDHLVINGKTPEETGIIYSTLLDRTSH